MTFTFLDMAGKTLFVRDDAERAVWTQEELSLELEFPRIEDKLISTGQRVFFIDPATGSHQIYEVKQAKTSEPDHYQSVVAEHICISELSDEHMDESEITNKTASQTLQGVLNGTLWSVGTASVNPTSSADLSRGSVWQAVLQIKDNWNVYIEPRVTLAGNGTITRKLDIVSTNGTWNGVRLSVDKNFLDPSVTIDDSEVVTALYGYGGTDPNAKIEEDPQEITFADVVWTKTADHPAKPKGQKYLEDPAATAAYGRNGRARFGYYQNNDITDPEILLQKTWETLKNSSKPAISIEGTVADLYRLGYVDTPIKLHDIALVEVNPAGYKEQIQIIRLTVDLLDKSATTLTIGAYIPNIIYIERKTDEKAGGGRGGGGGNKSSQDKWQEFKTTMHVYEKGTGMAIRSVQNDIKNQQEEIAIQEAQLEVTYKKITAEVTDRRNADNVLNGKITVEAGRIEQIVSSVGKDGQVTAASIVAAINGGSSSVEINADHIDINGIVTKLETMSIGVGSLRVEGRSTFYKQGYFEDTILAEGNITSNNVVDAASGFKTGNYTATWKSKSVITGITRSSTRYICYAINGSTTNLGTMLGSLVTDTDKETIYYLGR